MVEGKPIYANKASVCPGSTYFTRMFTSDFKEKDMKEIPLPGKTYRHVVDLMNMIHQYPCLNAEGLITGIVLCINSINICCSHHFRLTINCFALHLKTSDMTIPPILKYFT